MNAYMKEKYIYCISHIFLQGYKSIFLDYNCKCDKMEDLSFDVVFLTVLQGSLSCKKQGKENSLIQVDNGGVYIIVKELNEI